MFKKYAKFPPRFIHLAASHPIRLMTLSYYQWRRTRRLCAEAIALRQDIEKMKEPERVADLVLQSKHFRPTQKREEIIALFRLLYELQPKFLCEVGSFRGGTLALFCQVSASNAHILAIDLNFKPEQLKALRHFARRGQRVVLVKGDSHAPETLEKVRKWLGKNKLDFLFIDGDHSFEGVMRDFQMYRQYVRRGGLIAFHDIVPDYRTRYGIETNSFTGGVPLFWQRLKQEYPDAQEIIADPQQDGFGIGLIVVKS